MSYDVITSESMFIYFAALTGGKPKEGESHPPPSLSMSYLVRPRERFDGSTQLYGNFRPRKLKKCLSIYDRRRTPIK